MTKTANKSLFPKTRLAMAAYLKKLPAAERAYNKAKTPVDCNKADLRIRKLESAVRLAFWEDTRDFNSRSACAAVNMSHLDFLLDNTTEMLAIISSKEKRS